jgi:NAD(P)-dependent dehydrogenase (short-subunit alcohol dehydrogenase family)
MRDPAGRDRDGQGGRGAARSTTSSNAAINPFMPWNETAIEDFNELFEVNVRGSWVVCTEGAKQMIAEGGGAIVMISSISAHVGSPTQVAYCGTKGAISMPARRRIGARRQRHPVNVVEPGAVKPT